MSVRVRVSPSAPLIIQCLQFNLLQELDCSPIILSLQMRGGAVWSARVAHNHKVVGSNPAPATKKDFSETGRSFLLGNTL